MPACSCCPVTRSKWGCITAHVVRQHLADALAMGVLVRGAFWMSSI